MLVANAGITGRSGGGAVTWFTAAVDERFRVASPVHGTWSIGPHVANDVVREEVERAQPLVAGQVLVRLMTDYLADYIAAVKADQAVPALNDEFFRRAERVGARDNA